MALSSEEVRQRNREAQKRYRSSDKFQSKYINNHIRRKYGITYDEYLGMLQSQGNVCKICKGNNIRKSHRRSELMPLFVDHDHQTGKVRGLLCNHCNVGIAMFKDNIEHLTSAINYLMET